MNEKLDKIAFVLFLVLVASLSLQKPNLFYVSGLPVTVPDVVFPLAGLFFLISLIPNFQKIQGNKAYLLLGAYLGAFLVATLFSPQFTRSGFKTLATGYLIGLSALAFNATDSEKRMRLTVRVWILASIVPLSVGLFAIALFYISPTSLLLPYLTYHYGAVPVGNYPRLSSTFNSASMFCNFLNVELLLLLIAKHKNWIGKSFFWILLAATAVCATFTISSGLGAIFLAAGIWIWYSSSNTLVGRIALASGALICLLSLTASFIALQPHSTAPYSKHLPIINVEVFPSSRLMVWSEAIGKFLDDPIFGNGPGTPSAGVKFENTDGSVSILTDAHNSYLSIATQTGVIGLLAMIGLTIYLLRTGFQTTRNKPLLTGLAIAFLSAFAIQGLTGAFEDARHLWVLMGMLIAATTIESKEESTAEVGRRS